jgi:hypothetical protein
VIRSATFAKSSVRWTFLQLPAFILEHTRMVHETESTQINEKAERMPAELTVPYLPAATCGLEAISFPQGWTVTMATFCKPGQAERIKGGVHAAACTIGGVMAVYNAVAWWHRRDRHLAVNAVLYTAGFAWEIYQTSRHFGRPELQTTDSLSTPAPAIRIEARVIEDDCQCGDGFCWCGSAESQTIRFAAS